MEFKDLSNEKINQSAKKAPKPKETKEVLINDVVFIFDNDTEENFDNIQNFQQLLLLDKKKPNLLIGVKPPLYSAFKASVNKNIEVYVEMDDDVIFKNPAFSPDKENPVRIVSNVYPKSLGSMSVIIADFMDGEFALTNHLKIVK